MSSGASESLTEKAVAALSIEKFDELRGMTQGLSQVLFSEGDNMESLQEVLKKLELGEFVDELMELEILRSLFKALMRET